MLQVTFGAPQIGEEQGMDLAACACLLVLENKVI